MRESDRRPPAVSLDVRRRRLVRLAEHAVERRRARSLVLVAETGGPAARHQRDGVGAARSDGLGPVSRRAEPRLSGTGPRARPEDDRAAADRDAPRHDASGTAAGRQHARLQPGGDRFAGAADVGRASAGPRGRAAERAPALLRSRSKTRRRAGRCGGAGVGAVGYAHGRDAGQPQPIAAADA